MTLPNNFVTVFHTVTADLGLPLPWPKPDGYIPPQAEDPILIWGGASSVGQYAIQILSYYGYRSVITTASPKHHKTIRSLGAAKVFDYRSPSVTSDILEACAMTVKEKPAVPLILDCIGSSKGTVEPITKIAQKGSIVAVLLPIILKDSTEDSLPEYTFDVAAAASWAEGVNTIGVRTHFYLDVSPRSSDLSNALAKRWCCQERLPSGSPPINHNACHVGRGYREAQFAANCRGRDAIE